MPASAVQEIPYTATIPDDVGVRTWWFRDDSETVETDEFGVRTWRFRDEVVEIGVRTWRFRDEVFEISVRTWRFRDEVVEIDEIGVRAEERFGIFPAVTVTLLVRCFKWRCRRRK